MKNLIKSIILIFLITIFVGCANSSHHHVKMHRYRTSVTNSDGSQSFIYWYVMMSMLNGSPSYYYYSSSSPLTDYSNVSWTKSQTEPDMKETDEENVEQLPDEEINENDFSDEMQNEVSNSDEESDNSEASDDGDDDGGSSDGGGDSGGDGGGGGE